MKLEIYQVGKVPLLTVVECDGWKFFVEGQVQYLKCYKNGKINAIFFTNNIAGFKEVE